MPVPIIVMDNFGLFLCKQQQKKHRKQVKSNAVKINSYRVFTHLRTIKKTAILKVSKIFLAISPKPPGLTLLI